MAGHKNCSKTQKPGEANCWLFGPPCPPWSRLRYKKGSTKATSSPGQHPAYSCTMSDMPFIVKSQDPDGGIIEQVYDGFTDVIDVDGEDPREGEAISDAVRVINGLVDLGYSVVPARMLTHDFMDVSRTRTRMCNTHACRRLNICHMSTRVAMCTRTSIHTLNMHMSGSTSLSSAHASAERPGPVLTHRHCRRFWPSGRQHHPRQFFQPAAVAHQS